MYGFIASLHLYCSVTASKNSLKLQRAGDNIEVIEAERLRERMLPNSCHLLS